MKTAEMDDMDERLLAELRRDGRAGVSDLAQRLGIARATVRSRMERLIQSGEIRGFAALTRAEQTQAPVRGLMMIGIEGRGQERITSRLLGLAEVQAVHSTNGKWDLIVELATQTLGELDGVIQRIRTLEGITTSETNLLLSSRGPARR